MNNKIKVILILILCLIGHSSSVLAQKVDESKVKAAFVYNFMKHTSWPDDQSKQRFTIAIYKDSDFHQVLLPLVTSKQLRDRQIYLINTADIDEVKTADVAIISDLVNDDIAKIASSLRLTNTLLITQNSSNKKDVMINFVRSNDEQSLSFEINKSNLIYEKLTISDELLLLGGSEIDVATLYRETELAMQEMKQQESKMQRSITSLQENLSTASDKLKDSEIQLTQNNKTLKQKESELTKRETDLQQLKLRVEEQNKALNETKLELTAIAEQRSVVLASSQKILEERDTEVQVRENEINQLEVKILENRNEIDEQLAQLQAQQVEITDKNQTIKIKDRYLEITIVFIVIVSIFMLLVVWLFVRNRKVTKQLQNTLKNLESAQSQLVQAEKMSSLGLLTAGISHEINTPLGVVITSLSIITHKVQELSNRVSEDKLTKSSLNSSLAEIRESTDLSNNSLTRVTTLISNFKQLAVDHFVEEPREFDLGKYISEFMNTLSSKLKRKNIRYECIQKNPITITTIPGALTQVLTNCVTNTIHHAFANITSNDDLPKITYELIENEDGIIKLIFSDNGCGMSTEILNKIYEPFYTTKRGTGGTGLGMHIVYNIVSGKLQGDIKIKSVLHEGTTIELHLPSSISIVSK
jgi:C4-dicarboxylate-specific signal transduction histidine kinase